MVAETRPMPRKRPERIGMDLPVFVLAVFAKNEKANLSAAERKALAKMTVDMIENYRRQK